ncbi:cytochrome P450 [Xylaria venustula]|nr:cytochrome P450 [Xylaria venustula]
MLYCLILGAYRLCWSPISKFPGPRLAALTYWYEAYYDLFSNGGEQFAFRINRMHEEYGPIVRVTPNELHIHDPEYYDVVFCNSQPSRPIDKIEQFRYRLNHPDSILSTVNAEDHKVRRAAVAHFFSQRRVRSYNDDLQRIVNRVFHKITADFEGNDRVIRVNHMWASLTADMIMELAFGHSSNMSEAPDFLSPMPQATSNFAFLAHYTTHFPVIGMVIKFLPNKILEVLVPAAKPLLQFRRGIRHQLRELMSIKTSRTPKNLKPSIFHDILESNLSPGDKSLERLTQEAMLVNGAAIETTTWTLTVATFYILFEPYINSCLKSELKWSMPDPDKILPWDLLQKLEYLSAIIMESLRLSFKSVQRLPRVNRLVALKYHDYEIPPNVPTGMDAFHMHMNEKIFPNPRQFQPEGWLGNPKGPNGLKPLSQYLVSFSRGARGCLPNRTC